MKLLTLLSLHRECKASYRIVYQWYEEKRDEAATLRAECETLRAQLREAHANHQTYVEHTNLNVRKLEHQLNAATLLQSIDNTKHDHQVHYLAGEVDKLREAKVLTDEVVSYNLTGAYPAPAEKVLTPAPAKTTRKRVNKNVNKNEVA